MVHEKLSRVKQWPTNLFKKFISLFGVRLVLLFIFEISVDSDIFFIAYLIKKKYSLQKFVYLCVICTLNI